MKTNCLTILVNVIKRNIIIITAVFAAVVFVCGCNPVKEPVTDDTPKNDSPVGSEYHSDPIGDRTEYADSKDEDKDKIKPKASGDNGNVCDKTDISVIMAGDVLLHIPLNRSCMLDDERYDYSCFFENTKDEIRKADLAVVNQEVIIGGKELGVTGYPSFNAPFEIADALTDAGFDVICHATNHALDRGKTGIVNCLDYWENKHPDTKVIGIYKSQKDRDNIFVYDKDGVKIAILNYTYGTNGIKLPDDMPYAVNLLNEKAVTEDLKRAEKLADFTIICPHWGTEYSHGISTEQDNWTQIFFEYGADLVLGTHPHVIEPIKWIEDDKTGRKMLVYYSIGNYVNWTAGSGPGTSDRMVGGIAKVNIGRDDTGEVVVKDYGVEAIVCHLTKEKQGITVYRLTDYDERLARSNEIVNQDTNFSRQYCVDLCNKVWGNKWE